MEEELNTAAAELGGLEEAFKEAKRAKEEWETEEQRLKDRKAELDADANATDQQK